MGCKLWSENKLVLNFDHGFMLCCLHLWGSLLARLYLEAPLITEEATELLKNMCGDETRAPVGLHLLQDLVIRRPPKQLTFLNALLLHTAHENLEVRSFWSLLFASYWFYYAIFFASSSMSKLQWKKSGSWWTSLTASNFYCFQQYFHHIRRNTLSHQIFTIDKTVCSM